MLRELGEAAGKTASSPGCSSRSTSTRCAKTRAATRWRSRRREAEPGSRAVAVVGRYASVRWCGAAAESAKAINPRPVAGVQMSLWPRPRWTLKRLGLRRRVEERHAGAHRDDRRARRGGTASAPTTLPIREIGAKAVLDQQRDGQKRIVVAGDRQDRIVGRHQHDRRRLAFRGRVDRDAGAQRAAQDHDRRQRSWRKASRTRPVRPSSRPASVGDPVEPG